MSVLRSAGSDPPAFLETCALQYEPVTERTSSLQEAFEDRRCAAFRNVTTLAFQFVGGGCVCYPALSE